MSVIVRLSILLLFGIICCSTEKAAPRHLAQSKEAAKYCAENNLNTSYCVLIDMHIHSGKNRMVLWDLKNDSAVFSCLCSHGCGNSAWGEDHTRINPVFSNTEESHCSSLGKYKIGKRGWSNWGIHVNYKLHGLESTNNNAYDRLIVLHSWDAIPETEPYPSGTPEGWGCPAISNGYLRLLDSYLQNSNVPTLLWIYN